MKEGGEQQQTDQDSHATGIVGDNIKLAVLKRHQLLWRDRPFTLVGS
jgi:hypothetical protein